MAAVTDVARWDPRRGGRARTLLAQEPAPPPHLPVPIAERGAPRQGA